MKMKNRFQQRISLADLPAECGAAVDCGRARQHTRAVDVDVDMRGRSLLLRAALALGLSRHQAASASASAPAPAPGNIARAKAYHSEHFKRGAMRVGAGTSIATSSSCAPGTSATSAASAAPWIVDPVTYGADPTGTTDSTDAIQSALADMLDLEDE